MTVRALTVSGQIDLFEPDPNPTMTSCQCTPQTIRPCGHCQHCDTCIDCRRCAGGTHPFGNCRCTCEDE